MPQRTLPFKLRKGIGASGATDSCQIGRVVAGGRVVAYLSVWRAVFCLRPSERYLAASASSRLRPRLPTRSEWDCQRLLTVQESKAHALKFDQNGILLQVKCEKHGIPSFEASGREVCLRLVSLDATERCKLRSAICDIQNGLCTVLANVISQQTAKASRIALSTATDSRSGNEHVKRT